MCGRYAFNPGSDFYDRFSLDQKLSTLQSFSTSSPGQYLPVIYYLQKNIVDLFKWGIIPSWAKDKDFGSKLFNARSETILEKPSFRDSFSFYRCLVPCSGFFEAKKFFTLKDKTLFSFAGIYCGHTFTILTTQANDLIKPFHDRMPVILNQCDESIWLDPISSVPRLLSLLQPYPSQYLIS